MTKRPKSSKMQAREYVIEICPIGSILNAEGKTLWGETDHERQKIRLEDGMHPDKERAVMLHETLHQIFGVYGEAIGLTEEQEENVCGLLGEALLGHIRENPSYWRYLLKKA